MCDINEHIRYTRQRIEEYLLYNDVYDFANIKQAFYNARHGKLNNSSANKFEINMLKECLTLSDSLRCK